MKTAEKLKKENKGRGVKITRALGLERRIFR
jgi:hypothetical protein